MRRKPILRMMAGALALWLGALVFSPGLAQDGPASGLALIGESVYKVGEQLRLAARLLDTGATPLADQTVLFYLDGTPIGAAQTDSNGLAVLRFGRRLPAGVYLLEAVYDGRGTLPPVRTGLEILIDPALLTIQVLPPIAGITFSLDGQPFQSRQDGLAEIVVHQPGAYALELLPLPAPPEGVRRTFRSWDGGEVESLRKVQIAGDQVFQAGFEIEHRVAFEFFGPDGEAIPSLRVDSVAIRSSNGGYRTLPAGEPAWLESSVIFNRVSGLDSVSVVHSIQNVIVDGSNVVNRGQQRMTVQQGGVLPLELLVFDTQFYARDLFFHHAIGDGVEITFPDGSVRRYPFDSQGQLALQALARGDYQARLTGISGFSIPVSIILSRSQSINLPALTGLDLAALASLALLAGGGVIVVGRLRKFLSEGIA